MYLFRFWVLFTLTILCTTSFGQNQTMYGVFPDATNFSVNDYKASAQIWHGTQDKSGQLYFANNKGVLIFDGLHWSRIVTSQQSAVTRLFRASNDTIYVGAKNEIGLITHDSVGKLFFVPLDNKLLNKEAIGAVWNIFETKQKQILFFGSNGVLSYENGNAEVILKIDDGRITTSQRFGNGFLALIKKTQTDKSSEDIKLLYLADGSKRFVEITPPSQLHLKNIRGAVEINNKLILFDEQGTYVTATQIGNNHFNWVDNEVTFAGLSQYKINVVLAKKDLIYIGTDNDGLLVYNKSGKLIRQFSADAGLINVSVFELFFDRNNNLWLLLDNGISLIELSSPVTFFKQNQGILAATESIEQFNNKQILATRTDLFLLESSEGKSQFMNSGIINEPTFGVEVYQTSFGEKCLVIGYNGIYELTKDFKKQIVKYDTYVWALHQSKENPNVIYCGFDSPGGIGRLEITSTGWDFQVLLPESEGEVRSLVEHQGKIYFAVKDKGIGIYHLASKKVEYITEQPKIKDNLIYFVCLFQNKLFVGSNNGLYTIEDENKLKPFDVTVNKTLHRDRLYVHRIYNDGDNKLWLVLFFNEDQESEYREIGYIEYIDNQWEWTKPPLPLVEQDVIHTIKSDKNKLIWMGGEKGVYVYNEEANQNITVPFKAVISRIITVNDTLHGQHFSSLNSLSLSFSNNSIRFEFTTPVFYGAEKLRFRTRLDGFDNDWSDWSNINFMVYNKLSEGVYTLNVQSEDIYGNLSAIDTYTFIILPPWYRTWWAYVCYMALLIIIIYGLIRISIRRVKLQNQRLEDTVKERTQEIAKQKNKIEEINRDLVDSIKYAKRIQNTILPSAEHLNSMHVQHFVFYRPKDIVSGDFYWAEMIKDIFLFSAIDCTGHGVPGAFVSIVGHNGLVRATNEFELLEPNKILDKLRDIVLDSFRGQNHSEVKDGMDISLCAWNKKTNELLYSGANNPCVIIRKGEIIEIKADKQPIGQFENSKPFTLHRFQLEKDDAVYLYTDGYIDQFGGPTSHEDGKKFKSKPFKELLSSIYHLPMNEQYLILEKRFDAWKGNMEQVDDVCVFGIKI